MPDVPLFYVLDKFVEKKIRTYTSCSETVFRRSTQIYRNNKIRLYETFIKPVLCYGSIHWTLTEMTLQQVLRTFDSLALWKIINEEDAVLIPKKSKRQLFYKTTTVQSSPTPESPLFWSESAYPTPHKSGPTLFVLDTFYIPSMPRSSKWCLSFRFLHQTSAGICHFPHTRHMLRHWHINLIQVT